MHNEVLAALQAAGHEAYIVGGAVRDLLLGKEPKDYDVATSALPAEVLAIFPEGKMIDAAQAYPVVLINGMEVATFRADGKDRTDLSGMKVGATIHDDANRRDFTFNALYMARDGSIVDPTGLGLSDLREGIVRFVGNPAERLQEDPLRALRAVRFAARFGFTLEEGTKQALRNLRLSFR